MRARCLVGTLNETTPGKIYEIHKVEEYSHTTYYHIVNDLHLYCKYVSYKFVEVDSLEEQIILIRKEIKDLQLITPL